jgi:hypothetical protein
MPYVPGIPPSGTTVSLSIGNIRENNKLAFSFGARRRASVQARKCGAHVRIFSLRAKPKGIYGKRSMDLASRVLERNPAMQYPPTG